MTDFGRGQRQDEIGLPGPIAAVLVSERRRENLMIADALRQRAEGGPAAALMHHGAALLKGLAAGGAVVLPLVFWQTGHLTQFVEFVQEGEAKKQAGVVGGALPVLRSAPRPAERPSEPERSALETREIIERQVAAAKELLTRGQVKEARAILVEPDIAASPEGAYVLAETYDPNVLAALDIKGVSAEVDHARRLYTAALIGGIEAARQRLAALQ